MPFHPIETRTPQSRLFTLFNLTGALLFLTTPCFAQDTNLRPDTQAEYDAAQKAAVMQLRKTEGLLTPEVFSEYEKVKREYRDIIYRGTTERNARALEIIEAGLAYKLYALSDRTVQDDPRGTENAFTSIDRDIGRAGGGLTNADDKKRFRQLLFRRAFPYIQSLLKNNYVSRSLALEVLLKMEVVQARGQGRIEMFDQTHEVIVSILEDPTQPDAVKVRAANSAKRYLQRARAVPRIENQIGMAMALEAKRRFVGIPYQNALLMALEKMNAPRQLVSPRQPIALKVAVELMADKNQPIRTRCRAARLAGRTSFDNQVKYEPVAWLITDVALETALLFSQSKEKSDISWQLCGWYLYTAFKAENRTETKARIGMLNRDADSKVVSGAYQAMLPLVKHLLAQKGSLTTAVGNANTWYQANKPANLIYDTTCPPIAAGP